MMASRQALLAIAFCTLSTYAVAQGASGVGHRRRIDIADEFIRHRRQRGRRCLGGTSASTLGTAGTSTGSAGTSSSMGVGGSAAGGKASAKSKVNPNASNGHAKAMANEGGGEWSKSMTHTKDKNGSLSSRTKSMAHSQAALRSNRPWDRR